MDDWELCVFCLFACCVPVRGARRSVICDLQRQVFHFIPNGLYEILTAHREKTIKEIKVACGRQSDEVIDEYFVYLIEQEFGFLSKESENFPLLDLSWQRPERITNAIIDIDSRSNHDFDRLFRELDDLGCKALELRFFHRTQSYELGSVLDLTRGGRLRSISLVVGWSAELTPEVIEQLAGDHPRIEGFVVHSAPQSCRQELKPNVVVHYVSEVVDSPKCCGQIHPGYFVTNIHTFTEAQRYNTCLNRKIAIDARGDIRNCPSLSKAFGNSRDVSLHSALARRDFAQLWEINKDQVEICKDCEFRYICTDCRAYLSEPGNPYSKPAKCTYDPYAAKWGNTSSNGRGEP